MLDGSPRARTALAIGAVASLLAVSALVQGAVTGPTRASAASAPPVTYYLALGDSLSTGGGATPGHGYVDDVYAALSARVPGLQLENLGCAGDSTQRMIHGGLCTNYATGNQLGDAEAFLLAHPGQIAFATIDIGGDDIDGCASGGVLNPTCVTNSLARINTNLAFILSTLRNAAGSIPLIGMNYYDPFLAAWYSGAWFHGPPSQDLARASVPVAQTLNQELTTIYGQYDVPVADVATPFDTTNFALTGSYLGTTLPQNVANICNWTHMCMTGGGNPNIHTTDFGHSLIATAYEKELGTPVVVPGSASVDRGSGGTTTVDVPVTLSNPSPLPATVQWNTHDGTALAPRDYVAASGTLTFAPGQTKGSITVTVNGDPAIEPDETFLVVFSAPTNATIGGFGLGSGVITSSNVGTVTTNWTTAEQPRVLQSATYLGQAPEQLQKSGVELLAYLLASAHPRPAPSPIVPPPSTGPVAYSTTWTGADVALLKSVEAQYTLTAPQAQKFSVVFISFLLALGGH
jgi:lysophospholipase L1-like esterase